MKFSEYREEKRRWMISTARSKKPGQRIEEAVRLSELAMELTKVFKRKIDERKSLQDKVDVINLFPLAEKDRLFKLAKRADVYRQLQEVLNTRL